MKHFPQTFYWNINFAFSWRTKNKLFGTKGLQPLLREKVSTTLVINMELGIFWSQFFATVADLHLLGTSHSKSCCWCWREKKISFKIVHVFHPWNTIYDVFLIARMWKIYINESCKCRCVLTVYWLSCPLDCNGMAKGKGIITKFQIENLQKSERQPLGYSEGDQRPTINVFLQA